jgi:hypothetical protein
VLARPTGPLRLDADSRAKSVVLPLRVRAYGFAELLRRIETEEAGSKTPATATEQTHCCSLKYPATAP